MSRKYSREDKLRIINSLILTEGWGLLKSEIEQQILNNQGRIDSAAESGDTNRLFAAESYRLALTFVLNLPDKIQRENTAFFDRLYQKIASVDE